MCCLERATKTTGCIQPQITPAQLCFAVSATEKDATRYDPHGRPGRIHHGHLEAAWDLGESHLKVNPRIAFPQAGRCYNLRSSNCCQPRMKSSSTDQGGMGHNNQLLSFPITKEMPNQDMLWREGQQSKERGRQGGADAEKH